MALRNRWSRSLLVIALCAWTPSIHAQVITWGAYLPLSGGTVAGTITATTITATGNLTGRGLLEADGMLTPAGRELRAHIEAETDELAAAPWRQLGDQRTEEVIAIGKAMTRTALAAGAFPADGVFAAG